MITITTVDELHNYEQHCIAVCSGSSDQIEITCWSEHANGFVVVDGKPVQGGCGVHKVSVVRELRSPCYGPNCKNGAVVTPQALFVRYEHALGRLMYWFSRKPGVRVARYCETCTRRNAIRAHRKFGA